jgi:dolichyl-phosphate beta-glucosyltransferase
VRAGVLAAAGQVVAFCDADLSYGPAQVGRLLEQVEAGWDVAVGSRRHVDTVTLVQARRIREVTGRVFSALTAMSVLDGRHDTQCGVKAFSAEAAGRIFGRARLDGFAFDVEIFVIAARAGLSLEAVPVELSNSGASSVRIGRDTLRMLRDLARVWWWARTGAYDRGR